MDTQHAAHHEGAVPRYKKLAELRTLGIGARQIALLWGVSTQRVYQLINQAKLYGYIRSEQ
jgi:hypothetical protein